MDHKSHIPTVTAGLMGELLFGPEADQQLVALRADASLNHLYQRVNDALDDIEDDRLSRRIRRRRYHRPAMWGVPVHGSGEEWLILWSEL